ncbi:hypothetical protein K474DRAFT_1511085 [Panus rudis PR-1116 ss-1]|nr:hypothetical protein K474DRAFT_1511085 [Panus rudis PR-1116 ss-1]
MIIWFSVLVLDEDEPNVGSSSSTPQKPPREVSPEIEEIPLPKGKGKARDVPTHNSASSSNRVPISSQATLVNSSQRLLEQLESVIPSDHPFAQSDDDDDDIFVRPYSVPPRPRPRVSQFAAGPSSHPNPVPPPVSQPEQKLEPEEDQDDEVVEDRPPPQRAQPKKRRRVDVIPDPSLVPDIVLNEGPPARNTRARARSVEPIAQASSRPNVQERVSGMDPLGEEEVEGDPDDYAPEMEAQVVSVEAVGETYQDEEFVEELLQSSDINDEDENESLQSDRGTDDDRTEARLFRNADNAGPSASANTRTRVTRSRTAAALATRARGQTSTPEVDLRTLERMSRRRR